MERFLTEFIAALFAVIFAVIGGYIIASSIEPSIGEKKAAGALAFVFIPPLLLIGALIGKYVAKKLLGVQSASHNDV